MPALRRRPGALAQPLPPLRQALVAEPRPARLGAEVLTGVRYLVDGMNVIGTRPDGWWKDRDAAMVRLVDRLERWSAETGDDITVVFERKPRPPLRSSVIEVAHAPKARPNSADDEIVRRVRADANPSSIRVVTSDNVLTDLVHGLGATVEPAAAFRDRID
jgi:predicted RNA-binding protein with PIN domain